LIGLQRKTYGIRLSRATERTNYDLARLNKE
jgi:hypothetical protein